ncbi:ABC transporter permease subunit, partial [Rhizobium ruizarguesonis]
AGHARSKGDGDCHQRVYGAGTEQDYVNAAIARGESSGYIIRREMMPNVIAPIIVEMTIRVSFAVMLFAKLSFLGLGAQPPAAEWGLM